MTPLIHLVSNKDFQVINLNNNNRPVLTITPPGLVLVMFYSDQCAQSTQVMPQYKQLPNSIGGCKFAIANARAGDNRIAKISAGTKTPITSTPTFILYYNRFPEIIYSGDIDKQSVGSFIKDMTIRINERQKKTQQQNTDQRKITGKQEEKTKIPDYCLGKPNDDEDSLCYLSYDNAYS